MNALAGKLMEHRNWVMPTEAKILGQSGGGENRGRSPGIGALGGCEAGLAFQRKN